MTLSVAQSSGLWEKFSSSFPNAPWGNRRVPRRERAASGASYEKRAARQRRGARCGENAKLSRRRGEGGGHPQTGGSRVSAPLGTRVARRREQPRASAHKWKERARRSTPTVTTGSRWFCSSARGWARPVSFYPGVSSEHLACIAIPLEPVAKRRPKDFTGWTCRYNTGIDLALWQTCPGLCLCSRRCHHRHCRR